MKEDPLLLRADTSQTQSNVISSGKNVGYICAKSGSSFIRYDMSGAMIGLVNAVKAVLLERADPPFSSFFF